MKLPAGFLEKMKNLLGEKEYGELLESYNQPRYYGLRVNTLKINVDDFLENSPFLLTPVPWTADGFYYPEGINPGRHPYYHAGLYYIQEPSAMLPGQVLGAKPGERVLDLCAAPGGKTVQIAAAMKGEGLLVANDISADRVKALVKNIELCGVRNALVTNDTPDRLAAKFPGYFDRILVDAPCSGEGMFRKDEDAARSWESFKCETCAGMQKDILRHVDAMLKPGGKLVYSTCTFSPEEDEVMIAHFMETHQDYEIAEIEKIAGIESGRPEWAGGDPRLAGTARLWPHRVKGEGHFAAALVKKGEGQGEGFRMGLIGRDASAAQSPLPAEKTSLQPPAAFARFAAENLTFLPEGHYLAKGKNLYWLPEAPPVLDGLKIAKFGWFLGEMESGRFEPSHSLMTALHASEVKRRINLEAGSREVLSYLKGETLMLEGEKGWTAVCVDSHTLGWGKQTGDMLKNQYPKGWRKMS